MLNIQNYVILGNRLNNGMFIFSQKIGLNNFLKIAKLKKKRSFQETQNIKELRSINYYTIFAITTASTKKVTTGN